MAKRIRAVAATLAGVGLLLVLAVQPVAADRFYLGIGILACTGDVVEKDETWSIKRSDLGHQFANGETVKLSILTVDQPPNATMTVKLTDATVVLPADWTSQGENATSADTFGLHLRYQATGMGEAGARVYLLANGQLDYVFVIGTIQCNGSGTPIPLFTPPDVAPPTQKPASAPTQPATGSAGGSPSPAVVSPAPGESTEASPDAMLSDGTGDGTGAPSAVGPPTGAAGETSQPDDVDPTSSAGPSPVLVVPLFGLLGAAVGLLAWTLRMSRGRRTEIEP